eukprot:275734-Pelagomonas_calceolata.AAC.1
MCKAVWALCKLVREHMAAAHCMLPLNTDPPCATNKHRGVATYLLAKVGRLMPADIRLRSKARGAPSSGGCAFAWHT